jgi:salicylate hydroxylase
MGAFEMSLDVVVVGAGAGGIAAGLSLARAGARVTVYEQAPELTEVGAGIQLAPNATRALRHLGALDPLLELAHIPAQGSFRRWEDGRLLSTQVLGGAVEEAFGAPYLQLHRGDMVIGMASALAPGVLRLGRRAVGVEQSPDRAIVQFDDGERVKADAVIVADGVNSVLRHQLTGTEQVTFSGSAAYRGLVPAADVEHLDLEPYSVWLGPGRHFVQYYVRGGELLNFVGIVDSDWTEQSWTTKVDTDRAVAEYADWDPKISGMLASAPSAFLWALTVREPLPHWSIGRIALLGDSAHAMVPFVAQGAAQAILDAAVLGRCLEGIDASSVEDAMTRYSGIREQASAGVARAATQTGLLYNAPDGTVQEERDRRYAEEQESNPFGPQAAFWGYDPFEQPLIAPTS